MNSFLKIYLQLFDQGKNDRNAFGWMALSTVTHALCRMLSHATLTSNFLPAGRARRLWPIFSHSAGVTVTENKITHETTKVIACPISKRASSNFNGGAYEPDDRLLFFYPRDPRNLVFHLKFKSTSAPLVGSPRSHFVWGEKKHSSIPRYRPRGSKAQTK